jgi:hypothetical protein
MEEEKAQSVKDKSTGDDSLNPLAINASVDFVALEKASLFEKLDDLKLNDKPTE